jgi:asparagine synthase (glutamine-hydrolysing)
MCGIVGYLSCKRIEKKIILDMLSQIEHRGPDAGYLYFSNNVSLGVRRLSIVNLKNGHQPAYSQDKTIVAVFNGEIYNHKEIKSELISKGYVIKDGSDVEIIPHAYQEWGSDFCSHFNGDFAIALYLKKEKKILLARDRNGIKPLYYTKTFNGDLVFASEIKSIFAHPEVERRFDFKTLMQIFTFWTPIDSKSVFFNIHQIAPGTISYFDLQGNFINKFRYWDVPYKDSAPIFNGDFFEAKLEFSRVLKKSVELRLDADVEVGTYTSGGIDSSIINYIASKELKHSNVETFSVVFDDPLLNEERYQRDLSSLLGLNYHQVKCHNSNIVSDIEKVVYYSEVPLFRTAPIPMYALSKKVRETGLKVVLSGEGADEVIWGYDIFREAKVRQFWSRSPESQCRPQLFKRMYDYLPQFQNPRFFNINIEFFKYGLTDTDDPLYSHALRILNSSSTHAFLSEEFNESIKGYSPTDDLIKSLPEDYNNRSLLEKTQYLEMKTLLSGYLLSSQGDRMLSANGIEGRYPYLDHNFIGLMASMPEKYKLNGLRDKFIMRQLYSGKLPDHLLNRKKHAYRAPEIYAFLNQKNDLIDRYMNKSSLNKSGIFNSNSVSLFIDKIKKIKPENISTRDNLAFIQIISTQILHSIFIENFSLEKTGNIEDIIVTEDV